MTWAVSDRLHGFSSWVLLIGLTAFWSSDTVVDPDLWGHVRFGQDILRTASVARSDPYSYRSSGRTWVNHEWLAEATLAGLYDATGPAGLVAFKVLVTLVIVLACFCHLRRQGLGPFAALAVLVLVSVPLRMGLGTVRPQLFTYLFFLILLLLIEGASRGRERWLWAAPVLLAVWSNLHGGVLAGVAVVALWAVVRLVRPTGDLGRFTHAALLLVACGLALLLNPYGVGLIIFLLRTATVPRPEIAEWAPLAVASLPGLVYLGLLMVCTFGLVASRRRRVPEALLILGATAVGPLISNRHFPLFALALVVLGGEHLADAWGRRQPRTGDLLGRSRGVAAAGILVSLILIGLALPRFGCIRVDPYYFPFPARAVALLKESRVRGNLAVPFAWGEYVIWHLGPGVKVSVDGRRETVYPEESYRQSLDFERGTGDWDALLKAAPTELILAPFGSPTANLMSRTGGWVPVYGDSFCMLFVRAGSPSIRRIVETPVPALPDDGAGLCFPSPGHSSRPFSLLRGLGAVRALRREPDRAETPGTPGGSAPGGRGP
jgi:hypothetical protein